jgi:hypothetical protein
MKLTDMTPEQKCRYAICLAWQECSDTKWRVWAAKWIADPSGLFRTSKWGTTYTASLAIDCANLLIDLRKNPAGAVVLIRHLIWHVRCVEGSVARYLSAETGDKDVNLSDYALWAVSGKPLAEMPGYEGEVKS